MQLIISISYNTYTNISKNTNNNTYINNNISSSNNNNNFIYTYTNNTALHREVSLNL